MTTGAAWGTITSSDTSAGLSGLNRTTDIRIIAAIATAVVMWAKRRDLGLFGGDHARPG